MNVFFNTISSHSLFSLKESISVSLSPLQKKISILAGVALAILASCLLAVYLFKKCCGKVKTPDLEKKSLSTKAEEPKKSPPPEKDKTSSEEDKKSTKAEEPKKSPPPEKDKTSSEEDKKPSPTVDRPSSPIVDKPEENDKIPADFNGEGTFNFNGREYKGTFVNGNLVKGTITFPPSVGLVWEGHFKNDLLEGIGKASYPVVVREGVFKEGALYGKGKTTYKSGTEEEGEYCNNVLNGDGIRILPNKEKEEGTFVDGKLHGRNCTRTSPDGTVEKGVFKRGVHYGPSGSY